MCRGTSSKVNKKTTCSLSRMIGQEKVVVRCVDIRKLVPDGEPRITGSVRQLIMITLNAFTF